MSNDDKKPISSPFSKVMPFKQGYIKRVRDYKAQISNADFQVQSAKEQRVLQISMMSALFLAIFGIGFGVAVKSLAVVFDGFVSLVSVGLGALSVVTSRYIYKDDDENFQFGYMRFEPMVNLFKSLVLIFVCVYAFINAFSSIISGGYEVHLGGAAVYSGFAFVFCLALFGYTSFAAKILESDLIKVDNIEWKIDCVLYMGALIAFGVIYVCASGLLGAFETSGTNSFGVFFGDTLGFGTFFGADVEFWQNLTQNLSRYIDPFLLATLSLALCVSPFKIAVANFKDLVMLAPRELDDKITQIMEQLSQKYGFSDYDTHTAKSGRFFIVEVNILVQKDFERSVGDLDKIREEIEKALDIPSYKIWLSVSWTSNPKWL